MQFSRITIYASNFNKTREFYQFTLGIPGDFDQDDVFTLQIGTTQLSIVKSADTTPYYHFAFDIPANHFHEAKSWLETRTTLYREDGKDHVYFKTLDATSLYFEDPAGNVVELMCRFSHSQESRLPFSGSSLLAVSEMSLVSKDKRAVANQLLEAGIPSRNGEHVPDEGLTFMGEPTESVYFLLVPEERIWYFSDKPSRVFPLEVELDNGTSVKMTANGTVQIATKN